jgi:hypothetical protein
VSLEVEKQNMIHEGTRKNTTTNAAAKICVLIGLVGLLPASLMAQSVAKYAGEFLAIGVGGRAMGMGGAYVALATDATSGYWNPAAAAALDHPEIFLMHDERFAGLVNYDVAAATIPYGSNASLGLTVLRLGVDGIQDTRNALIDLNGNGQFDPGDRIDHSKITYFSSADWAAFLTYAQRGSDDLSYGLNLKLIRRSLGDATATGIGFDLGVRYRAADRITLGANLQDATTSLVAWSTGRNELVSPTLKVGGAASFDLFGGVLTPALDIDVRFENRRYASTAHLGPISFDPRLGLEFDYRQTVAVRGGMNDLRQLSVGAGLHLRKLELDYSFTGFGNNNDLGSTHRISLRILLQEERFARGSMDE